MRRPYIAVLSFGFALSSASVMNAQTGVRATVMSRDGATKMVLSDSEVIFQFTKQGAIDASGGLEPKADKDDWNWMDDVLKGTADGVKNMRIVFDMKNIRDAQYENGTLSLYMTSRSLTAPRSDKHGVFAYQEVPEDQAQVFIREFKRAKGRA
jgi:hypothetical protein